MRLEHWNFGDRQVNGAVPLIARQRSAVNLMVLAIDRHLPEATFYDPKRKARHTATLGYCDCRDFSFVGNSLRNRLQPCMHIYRLAMELGLLEAMYVPANRWERLSSRQPGSPCSPSRLAFMGAGGSGLNRAFGRVLRALRERAGLSQEALAARPG